jgi:hypothetical protein
MGDKCVGAIQESPLHENGTWAGRFVNRPYNFVADPRFAAESFLGDIGDECVGAIHESPLQFCRRPSKPGTGQVGFTAC